MTRSRLPALLLASLPASVSAAVVPATASASPSEGSGGRYPIWPTEIDRVAAPLRDPAMMSEGARVAALEELAEYATEVILPDLELALTDPSPEVRRMALQLCADRQVLACIDEAEQMWETGEGSVRLMALQLLSQDPTSEHLDLVYEAMRDPNDLIREQAIMLLVDAPLDAKRAAEARQELVAQLGDVSARVRRTAARSLGRMGPGDGALALVRLIDDVDPSVAEAAAAGLGQLADPRTAPALRRALDNPVSVSFAIAAVRSLASLDADDIDATLLALLDAPPRNMQRSDVARAIGVRQNPSAELIAGLVDRMRDPELREAATQALLWLGDRAIAQLEAAHERGLEPDIAVEVERLLAARRLPPTPRVPLAGASGALELGAELPPIADRRAWFELLGDPEAVDAGAALAEQGPSWLGGAIVWALERAASAEQAGPWLAALALAPTPVLDDPGDRVTWARVSSWAHDVHASGESRCLATLALGRAAGTRHAEAMAAELRGLAAAHVADVRGCAALALARFGEDPLLEALLADPSPRVRAATALGLRMIRKPSAQLRARLALQADRDGHMRARTSAALSLAVRPGPDTPWVLVRARALGAGFGADAGEAWERYRVGEREVDVPLLGASPGAAGWAIVPLTGARLAEVDVGTVVIPQVPDYGYYHYHM